ncbi:MAG: N-formylglutamate amidohydrolase [Clostridia bacterium]|nr:N-formylglutamate amidohydrolase [Clostridia bacterium]
MKTTTHESIKKDREEFLSKHKNKDHVFLCGKNSSVILSAPHGVRQWRNNKPKYAEPGTVNTLLHLQKLCECHAIVKTKNNRDDANYDEVSSYKSDLINYIKQNNIKYVLDIHSLAPERKCDINLGVNGGKNVETNTEIYRELVKSLAGAGFNVYLDVPFSAGERTIAGSMKNKFNNLWTIQIEINSKIAWHKQGFEKYKKLLDVLSTFIVGLR